MRAGLRLALFFFTATGRWPAPLAEVPGDETVKLIRCQTPAAEPSDPGFLTTRIRAMGTVLAKQAALGCTDIPFRRRAFLAEGREFRHCAETGRFRAEARVEFHNSQGEVFLPVSTSRCRCSLSLQFSRSTVHLPWRWQEGPTVKSRART